MRAEKLPAQVAGVHARAGAILANREGRHHGLAEQRACRGAVILVF